MRSLRFKAGGFISMVLIVAGGAPVWAEEAGADSTIMKFRISHNAYVQNGDKYRLFTENIKEQVSTLVANASFFEDQLLVSGIAFNPTENDIPQGSFHLYFQPRELDKNEVLLKTLPVEGLRAGDKQRILAVIEKKEFANHPGLGSAGVNQFKFVFSPPAAKEK